MLNNPFEVTKAVDFTDQEIASRFVSFAAADFPLVDPRSPITHYLVGGKGGGRTHLMRFYSYPLQKARAKNGLLARIKEDGYIGVYAPASGLDGSRFEGARIDDGAWRAVFAQSLEIRLVMLLLDALVDLQRVESPWSDEELQTFTRALSRLVPDLSAEEAGEPLYSIRQAFTEMQRAVDASVNNAPLTRSLDVRISFNPGALLFGIGTLVQQLTGLRDVKITYMLDELENLTESQQMFVNTLVREKQLPTCFFIGAREWGIRTYKTLSAAEENKEGSEFRKVVPETAYSQNEESYKGFCTKMVTTRLREAGLDSDAAETWTTKLSVGRNTSLMDEPLLEAIGGGERRHLRRLASVIALATGDPGLANEAVESSRFDGHPMLEKLTILRGYQAWSKARVFSPSQFSTARAFIEPLARPGADAKQINYLNLWKQDMAAQVYADHTTEQPYWGIDSLIDMSGHLPRSLLVTLKFVTSRADWRGEEPFRGSSPIPIATQSAGVREASAWYLNDVRPMGELGTHCDHAIRRLGSLLRDIRYADKPSEVNLTTFSSNLEGVDEETQEVLNSCVKHRMLIEIVGGRQARNQGSVHRKYQIHPMLAPFFGLGFGRRGDLTLSGTEVSALFSPDSDETSFQAVAKKRVGPMRAPFAAQRQDQLF